jgi:hypothetical protein
MLRATTGFVIPQDRYDQAGQLMGSDCLHQHRRKLSAKAKAEIELGLSRSRLLAASV